MKLTHDNDCAYRFGHDCTCETALASDTITALSARLAEVEAQLLATCQREAAGIERADNRLAKVTDERNAYKDAAQLAREAAAIAIAERDAARAEAAKAGALMDAGFAEYERRLSEARVALKEAVGALENIRDRQFHRMGPGVTAQSIARAFLARHKEQSHE